MPVRNDSPISGQDVMERFIAERGDLFEEFHLMASAIPDTVNLIRTTAGYVHFYENQTTVEQELSGPMRELIAIRCQKAARVFREEQAQVNAMRMPC